MQNEAQKARKLIKFLNEKSAVELKTIHIVHRIAFIMENRKIIENNHMHIQTKSKLETVRNSIATFASRFH